MLKSRSLALLGVLFVSTAGAADADVEAFYRNNRITISVASEPGGSLDTYARLVVQFMRKYIPGEPNIIVQHSAGAGGIVATSNFANVAPKDGTVLLLPTRDIALSQVIDDAPKFDVGTFNWIGRMVGYPAVVMVAARTGITTLEQAKTKSFIVASTNLLSQETIAAKLINHLLGTKMTVTTGYRGGPDMFLAMERGEADGRITPAQAMERQKPDWVKSKFVNYLAQSSLFKSPGIEAPLVVDLVSDQRGKAMVRLVDSGSLFGFSLATQGEVPVNRVAALREAFDKMMVDKEFKEQAFARNADLDYLPGAELTKFAKEIIATPKSTVDEARKTISEGVSK